MSELKMEQVFPVEVVQNGEVAVDGRLLLKWLGKDGTNFSRDIKRAIDRAGLVEHVDYQVLVLQLEDGSNSSVASEKKNYVFHPDSAKDIAMMDNSEKGQEVRAYFRSCEKVVEKVVKLTTSEIKDMLIASQEQDIIDLRQKKRQISGSKGGYVKDRNRWKKRATELEMWEIASKNSKHWSTYSGSKQLADLCNNVMESDYQWHEIEDILCDMELQTLEDGCYYPTNYGEEHIDGSTYGAGGKYNNWHLVTTTVQICKFIQD